MWPSLDLFDVIITFITLSLTYMVFGMMGFGSALLAAPILAHRMPLTSVVPLLALLDLAAAAVNTQKLSKNVNKQELFWLAPLMAIGSGVGIYLLLSIASNRILIGLGLFAISYSLFGLFGRQGQTHLSRGWVFPFGLVGGLFSGMFGSGGFIYSIYLTHRLHQRDSVRATMTAMTGLSTFTRVLMFTVAGAYSDLNLLVLAAFGLPALLLGLYFGHRITLRLSYERFFSALCVMLAATGASLIWRALIL